jgi:DIM1 family U5 snRNP protein
MSFKLPHLKNGCEVEQSILNEEERLVVMRFGTDWDLHCIQMDEVPYKVAEQI